MAISFNGSTHLRSGASTPTTTPATICGWARPISGDYAYLASIGSADGSAILGLVFHGGLGAIVASSLANGSWSSSIGQPWLLNQWQHCAAVFKADGTWLLYQDGLLTGTKTTVNQPSGLDQLVVGARPPGILPMLGDLAEVAVWSTELDDADVAVLAKGVTPIALAHRRRSLAAYHPLVAGATGGIPSLGDPVTTTGTPGFAEHPPVIRSIGIPHATPAIVPPAPVFPRLAAAACLPTGAANGGVFAPGAAAGVVLPGVKAA
ncbi:MAG: LamG-like jellyroll fold domain-containing protein [Planctomycetota bacterium]